MKKTENNSISANFISDSELVSLSKRVVINYVSKGSIPKREIEDVQMSIVEKFLSKKTLIIERYKGDAKVQTYCIAILNRMCCEVIRKDLKHWNIQNHDAAEVLTGQYNDHANLIKDEISYLHHIVWMMNDQKAKIRLFLTYYYQLLVLLKDIEEYDEKHKDNNTLELLNTEKELSKGEIFEVLSHVVNLVENKDLKSDAVRMWLNKNIQQIITRLNGPYFRAHYNKESFRILFEYYHDSLKNDLVKSNE